MNVFLNSDLVTTIVGTESEFLKLKIENLKFQLEGSGLSTGDNFLRLWYN